MDGLELLEKVYKEKVDNLEKELNDRKTLIEQLTNEKKELETNYAEIETKFKNAIEESAIVRRRAELMEELATKNGSTTAGQNVMELKNKDGEKGSVLDLITPESILD